MINIATECIKIPTKRSDRIPECFRCSSSVAFEGGTSERIENFFVVTEIAKGRKFNPASVISVIKKDYFVVWNASFIVLGIVYVVEMIIFPAI